MLQYHVQQSLQAKAVQENAAATHLAKEMCGFF